MVTDIDRLHNVVDNPPFFRDTGKTFAKCHEVAGFVELEFDTIVCIMTNNNDIHYLCSMLYEVLDEHEIKFKRGRNLSEYFANDTLLKFITERESPSRVKSYEGTQYMKNAVVWMRHED